jgi:hypothetical protein
METIINTLERAPIIPDFDIKKDNDKIDIIRKRLSNTKEFILSSHRLHWIARK